MIPLHFAVNFLSAGEIALFKEKFEEWGTPGKDRVYCPQTKCTAFIPVRARGVFKQPEEKKTGNGNRKGKNRSKSPLQNLDNTFTEQTITCTACKTHVCLACRTHAHSDKPCNPASNQLDETLTAQLEKWGYKRCPRCGHGVRRMHGCGHMECVCGEHWCWWCARALRDCENDGDCLGSIYGDYNYDDDPEEEVSEAEEQAEEEEEKEQQHEEEDELGARREVNDDAESECEKVIVTTRMNASVDAFDESELMSMHVAADAPIYDLTEMAREAVESIGKEEAEIETTEQEEHQTPKSHESEELPFRAEAIEHRAVAVELPGAVAATPTAVQAPDDPPRAPTPHPTQQPPLIRDPSPAPRRRRRRNSNLDAGSATYWELRGMDFGDEPNEGNHRTIVWDNIWHSWEAVEKLVIKEIFTAKDLNVVVEVVKDGGVEKEDKVEVRPECHYCWKALRLWVAKAGEEEPGDNEKGIAFQCTTCALVVCTDCKGRLTKHSEDSDDER
jgi:IBR domain, a half RING-finger domain